MLRRLILSVFVLFAAIPVCADDPQAVADTMVSDWQAWMQKHGIRQGALILSHNGTVIAQAEVARSVDDAAKVASLSKAITAICALKAADGAGVTLQTPLSEVIPAALAAHVPNDDRFGDITLSQLITHASGIDTDYHRTELSKLRTLGEENKLWQFSKIVNEPLSGTPAWAPYRYANANYLVLGLAIEELSGTPYETYCQDSVLAPLGITTAQLHPDWRVMSSWGGWEISARDYLTFVQAYFGGEFSPLRPAGYALDASDVGRGRGYSAGMIFRRTNLGTTSWHRGSWRGVRGRVDDPFGAFVALYDNGYSVVTNYAHDAWDNEIGGELDSLLYRAANP